MSDNKLNENNDSNEIISENITKNEDAKENNDIITENTFLKPALPITLKKSVKPNENKLPEQSQNTPIISEEKDCSSSDKSEETVVKQSKKELTLPYKEPAWGGVPPESYKLEIMKSGVLVDTLEFNKPFLVFGRWTSCDVVLEHPSISRFHCVIQYRAISTEEAPKGMYVYDLNSTHGSYQNKYQLKPKVYNRLRVGHMMKFGGSSRTFLLVGPSEDAEEESLLSVKELQEIARKREQEKVQLELQKEKMRLKAEAREEEERGINWGMGDDAEDSDEEGVNPYSGILKDELQLQDPKKSLRGWYEREGYDLPEYEVSETKPGHHVCSVRLPVLSDKGETLIATVEHKGSKKDTVVQAALEACKLLDTQGLFRQAVHESREKKVETYDSDDEDEFLDRTGDVAKKRDIREIKQRGKKDVVHTYEQLKEQHDSVLTEFLSTAHKLLELQKSKELKASSQDDDLDSYMTTIGKQQLDKHKARTYMLRCVELRKDEARLRRLVNIARPQSVAELQPPSLPADLVLPGAKAPPSSKMAIGVIPKSVTDAAVAKRKNNSGVHKIFLDEEEAPKLKLPKLDSSDDFVPKAIPYDRSVYKTGPSKTKQTSSARIPSKYVLFDEEEVKQKTKLNNPVLEASPCPATQATTIGSTNSGTIEPSSESLKSEELTTPDDTNASISIDSPPVINGDSEPSMKKVKPKMLGPKLPTPLEMTRSTSKKPKVQKKSAMAPDGSPAEELWLPPPGQCGDGRTRLNDKFGY